MLHIGVDRPMCEQVGAPAEAMSGTRRAVQVPYGYPLLRQLVCEEPANPEQRQNLEVQGKAKESRRS